MVAIGFIAEQIVFGLCSSAQFLLFLHLCLLSSPQAAPKRAAALAQQQASHANSNSSVSTAARPAGKLQKIFHRLGLLGSCLNLVRTVDRSGVYDIYPVGLSMMLNLNVVALEFGAIAYYILITIDVLFISVNQSNSSSSSSGAPLASPRNKPSTAATFASPAAVAEQDPSPRTLSKKENVRGSLVRTVSSIPTTIVENGVTAMPPEGSTLIARKGAPAGSSPNASSATAGYAAHNAAQQRSAQPSLSSTHPTARTSLDLPQSPLSSKRVISSSISSKRTSQPEAPVTADMEKRLARDKARKLEQRQAALRHAAASGSVSPSQSTNSSKGVTSALASAAHKARVRLVLRASFGLLIATTALLGNAMSIATLIKPILIFYGVFLLWFSCAVTLLVVATNVANLSLRRLLQRHVAQRSAQLARRPSIAVANEYKSPPAAPPALPASPPPAGRPPASSAETRVVPPLSLGTASSMSPVHARSPTYSAQRTSSMPMSPGGAHSRVASGAAGTQQQPSSAATGVDALQRTMHRLRLMQWLATAIGCATVGGSVYLAVKRLNTEPYQPPNGHIYDVKEGALVWLEIAVLGVMAWLSWISGPLLLYCTCRRRGGARVASSGVSVLSSGQTSGAKQEQANELMLHQKSLEQRAAERVRRNSLKAKQQSLSSVPGSVNLDPKPAQLPQLPAKAEPSPPASSRTIQQSEATAVKPAITPRTPRTPRPYPPAIATPREQLPGAVLHSSALSDSSSPLQHQSQPLASSRTHPPADAQPGDRAYDAAILQRVQASLASASHINNANVMARPSGTPPVVNSSVTGSLSSSAQIGSAQPRTPLTPYRFVGLPPSTPRHVSTPHAPQDEGNSPLSKDSQRSGAAVGSRLPPLGRTPSEKQLPVQRTVTVLPSSGSSSNVRNIGGGGTAAAVSRAHSSRNFN